jgi:hypothetical protein
LMRPVFAQSKVDPHSKIHFSLHSTFSLELCDM